MSQYGNYGGLLQQGLLGGLAAGQRARQMATADQQWQQEMALRQQDDELRRQAMQQEIEQRRIAAEDYAAQRLNDSEIMGLVGQHLRGTLTGNDGGMAGYGAANPGGVPEMPARSGMGPQDLTVAPAPSGMGPPAGENAAVLGAPQMGAMRPRTPFLDKIDLAKVARSSPRTQEMVSRLIGDEYGAAKAWDEESQKIQHLIGSRMMKYYTSASGSPDDTKKIVDRIKDLIDTGALTEEAVRTHAHPDIVSALDEAENARRDHEAFYLASGRAPGDGVGPTWMDSGLYAEALAAPTAIRRELFKRKVSADREQAYRAAAAQQALDAELAKIAARGVEARRTLAVRPAAVPIANDRTVQSFKSLLDLVDTETKGQAGESDIAKRRMAAEAYQAALSGLVTPDGWAVLNGGRPREDGAYRIASADGASGWITADALRAKMAGANPGAVPTAAQPLVAGSPAEQPGTLEPDEQAVLDEFRRRWGRTPNQDDADALFEIEQTLRGNP